MMDFYNKEFNKFWDEFVIYCKMYQYELCKSDFLWIMQHPLFNSNVILDKNHKMITITQDNFEQVVDNKLEHIKEHIDKFVSDKFIHLLLIVNKPYRINVFLLMYNYLNEDDYNKLLNISYTKTEFPNQFPLKILNKLFKRVNPKLYMDEDDYEIWKNLPDEIEIYRGLQDDKAKIKGISWSTDFEVAKWFACRWKRKGKIMKCVMKKEDIYVYDNGMAEREVIVNPFKLKNIVEVDYNFSEPIHPSTSNKMSINN